MPPKKKMAKPTATGAPPEGFTPERFERELKALASKAKEDTWSRNAIGQVSIYVKTALVLSLLGVYSNVSQLALSPVYGSIPASIWHPMILMVGCFIGWSGNLLLRRALPLKTTQLLPLIAIYIPTFQFFLYGFSDVLRAKWGPATTEGLTLLPLAVASAACVADYLEGAQLTMLPQFFADAAPGIGSWGFFKLMETISAAHLQKYVGQAFLFTRVGLQMLLAASYTVFAPSKYLLLTVPALLHTAVLNTHVMTPMATASLNSTLLSEQWMLLDRKESVTGYISVLENLEKGFRVMRCDHSLLGGEWIRFQGQKVSEPIYGVFVMLEAVRLVERKRPVLDGEASALVVGLGIGTTPSALISHGVDTTVVEIDPVVHDFALKYFNLKENNPPAIADAVSYTADLVKESRQTYDYIVHDVFTGGAEPVDLFTLEFLQGLSDLLKSDGVIAINYAGDFGLPTPKMIVRTIRQVFPSCRIFRESPRDEDNVKEWGSDFTNMVIFCRKTIEEITFRRPVEDDFLRSRARHAFLEPKHEVMELEFLEGDDTGFLLKNNTEKVTGWHQKSALGHWGIMRTVLPAKIWEMW
ncbi:Fc.00g060760.m01.CDS01 [Cosmosporella sp. VM-42]